MLRPRVAREKSSARTIRAVQTQGKLFVLLPPSESQSFKAALNYNFDSIIAALSKVDVKRAEAWRDNRLVTMLSTTYHSPALKEVRRWSGAMRERLDILSTPPAARRQPGEAVRVAGWPYTLPRLTCDGWNAASAALPSSAASRSVPGSLPAS